jgi:peptidase M1-like protein
MKDVVWIILVILPVGLIAGDDYWQQKVEYRMEFELDVVTHRFEGIQKLKYYNNSPDTLRRVFYHLYFNAFQPGSMMDERSRSMVNPDRRIGDRISKLTPDQTGYHEINKLTQDGKKTKYKIVGTILEVELHEAILPGSFTVLEMDFNGQVPIQIRRSGRDNAEGISYSMAQWYPKLVEYDKDGWHPDPYVGREFYGVWGDFEVFITIDKDFTIGATGYLQNADEIGHGFVEGVNGVPASAADQLTWHFYAPNVHDFVWAADPDYTHVRYKSQSGPELHFFYQENEKNKENWEALPGIMDKALVYINKHFGMYPYDQYSFIQGGDGGMEYPMATLIRGNGSFNGLVGVSVHEWMHSWYQMILGTNESLYPWMDEGFTSYAAARVMNELARQELLPGREYSDNPWEGTYQSFANFSASGMEEPLTTHSDHYTTNSAYGVGAYVKGNIFLNQLEYIIGKEAFDKTLLRYFSEWKFKHPDPDDFIRVAEKSSGMVLDWYKEYWINQTHSIDYALGNVSEMSKGTRIVLERNGHMPMPIEVKVTRTNGKEITYYIPLRIMRGAKPAPKGVKWEEVDAWPWTNTTYTFEIPIKLNTIEQIEIDPEHKMMDIDRTNDVLVEKKGKS